MGPIQARTFHGRVISVLHLPALRYVQTEDTLSAKTIKSLPFQAKLCPPKSTEMSETADSKFWIFKQNLADFLNQMRPFMDSVRSARHIGSARGGSKQPAFFSLSLIPKSCVPIGY